MPTQTSKEPSCVLNHEAMRRELRDKDLGPTKCPSCGWMLYPARELYKSEITKEDIREHVRELLVEWGVIPGAAEDE